MAGIDTWLMISFPRTPMNSKFTATHTRDDARDYSGGILAPEAGTLNLPRSLEILEGSIRGDLVQYPLRGASSSPVQFRYRLHPPDPPPPDEERLNYTERTSVKLEPGKIGFASGRAWDFVKARVE